MKRAAGAFAPGRNLRPPLAALLLAAAIGSGCSGLSVPPGGPGPRDTPGVTARQVLVVLPPAPPQLAGRNAAELASAYDLVPVLSWRMASLDRHCVVFSVAETETPRDVVPQLAGDPRVESAQPIQLFEVEAEAQPTGAVAGAGYNDPYLHLQHGLKASRADAAHRWATGAGIKVAVVDTGLDLTHPDLRGRVAGAGSFVDRGDETFTRDLHGTGVAGVIAAVADNGIGIAGVAPGAQLLALKACWQEAVGSGSALCNSYTLARALDAAIVQGAQVINLSLAGPDDPLLGRLLAAALERGTVVVAAGGGRGRFPSSVEGVVPVWAADLQGHLRGAPPRGDPPLAAPGVDVLTTIPGGGYDFVSGSSVAAAHAAGIAALLLERDPQLAPAALEELLRATARVAGEATSNPGGARLLDACAALARLMGEDGCP